MGGEIEEQWHWRAEVVGKPEPTCQQLEEKAAQASYSVTVPMRHECGGAPVLCSLYLACARPGLSAASVASLAGRCLPNEGESCSAGRPPGSHARGHRRFALPTELVDETPSSSSYRPGLPGAGRHPHPVRRAHHADAVPVPCSCVTGQASDVVLSSRVLVRSTPGSGYRGLQARTRCSARGVRNTYMHV